MSGTSGQEKLFKMKTVSQVTGLSPTLLRAWERRYDFLEPSRQPGGHRLYSEEDLKVLARVQELLEAGYSVGEAAAMGRSSLLGLAPRRGDGLSEEALSLVRTDLEVYRTARFRGEGLGVSLRDLNVGDLAVVSQLYDAVKTVYELWLYMDEARNEHLVRDRLEKVGQADFVARIARMGASGEYPPKVRAAVEDTRWGALGPLLRYLRSDDQSSEMLRVCVLLARDQAKIMRNCFYDLDEPLRAADESTKAHGIAGMVYKVSTMLPNFETLLDWEGSVSSRCLETSTVDRILYDFLRRLELTESASLSLWVGPVNDKLTRWAFRFEEGTFQAHQPEDLASKAVGMSVGLTPVAALEAKYLGNTDAWAWFHWPIFEVHNGAEICECEI